MKNNHHVEEMIQLKTDQEARILFGPQDSHLKLVRERCRVRLTARNKMLKVSGTAEQVLHAKETLSQLIQIIRRTGALSFTEILTLMEKEASAQISKDVPDAEHQIKPITEGQVSYVNAMLRSELVFAVGPAGTGKTLLAVDAAIYFLRKGLVRKLILTRPAVEAGERLGFLPGDFREKVNPYLRPLYDSLFMILGPEKLAKYMEHDIIEIAPLAYMRGRTLSNAFMILDEAQNTTSRQMQMFLTRFGQHSRCVVTGDMTQTDVPAGVTSGLKDVERVLKGIQGIEFAYLTKRDIVRHKLVESIVEAYERASAHSSNRD